MTRKYRHVRFLERQEARGLCLSCPQPARPGHQLCERHAEANLATATARARAKGMQPRTRRCSKCRRVQSDHDRRRCPETR